MTIIIKKLRVFKYHDFTVEAGMPRPDTKLCHFIHTLKSPCSFSENGNDYTTHIARLNTVFQFKFLYNFHNSIPKRSEVNNRQRLGCNPRGKPAAPRQER